MHCVSTPTTIRWVIPRENVVVSKANTRILDKFGDRFIVMLIKINNMKPTCIKYTNTYVYNIQACGFHQTIKLKIIY